MVKKKKRLNWIELNREQLKGTKVSFIENWVKGMEDVFSAKVKIVKVGMVTS